MNHDLWNRVAARVLALAFVTGLAACGDKISDVHSGGPSAHPVSPSAQVIGTAPAEPKGDTPQTAPVSPNTSDVAKNANGPKEGQEGSHSSVATNNPQKAEGKDPLAMPDRAKQ